MGVMGSAFMLGLNNMHRRKMRTGLTSATLILLTFVMISFTSVQNDLVEENTAIGKAPYQGMLIKRETFLPISAGEVVAFRNKYGEKYDVCERNMWVGEEEWRDLKRYNPELTATFEIDGKRRTADFESILQLQSNDPLRSHISFVSSRRWFTPEQDVDGSEICPALIPAQIAEQLNITPEMVNDGPVRVIINSRPFMVQGIFDATSLNNLRDLDGLDILPFDIENMAQVVKPKHNQLRNVIIAEDTDPRINARNIVITPVRKVFKNIPHASERTVSVVVSMPGESYKEAKEVITGFMEQTGEPIYYGLDGVAYRGRRTRGMSMAGLIDLIIPLLIAGLTVLNTMRGSVYERRGEIFVYNAVGIAPRYVFFMFIAEAFVYAVVGAVLGYLLSQGTGRVLTILDLTGGLNMTYTSVATIYASLTIVAAVFISTYFPAKSAMEISAPAEESGWRLPEPDEDDLAFDLPFNFGVRGRIAVLEFFDRYLQDNGEGSSGRFFAGVPAISVVHEADEGGEEIYIPQISAPIWLKPFDLGVSQQMTITMPTDPQTDLFKARITLRRLSGTREAWMRLNTGFVALVRRHFLHWRAVSPQEQKNMFEDSRQKLQAFYQVLQKENESVAS